jgi:hypothetical protein
MFLRKQGTLISRIYINSGWHQTWKKQAESHKNAKPPKDVKTIRSFVGLCNIFRMHIKHFAIIAAPLFKLTQKNSGYKGRPLPKEAMDAFCILQNLLTSEPVMAFPRADRQYALITDAATGTADTTGGLGIILTQKDEFNNFFAISYTSRQLRDHEKTTHHFSWKLPLLSGAWPSLTNTSKEKNSSYTRTINHFKKWDIFTQKTMN